MKISVGYQELLDIISAKTGQKIGLCYVSQDTVRLTKDVKLPLIGTKSIGLNVTVLGFEGQDLKLKAVSGVVSKLMDFIRWPDKEKYIAISNDCITVHLYAIRQMNKVFEHADLKSLSFTPEAVELETKIKI